MIFYDFVGGDDASESENKKMRTTITITSLFGISTSERSPAASGGCSTSEDCRRM